MAELAIRMVASLAIVVGLLLLIARVTGRRFQGRQGSLITVLHRQSLGRSSSVAVVSVGQRVLVLGSTEQQVAILAELAPGEVEALAPHAAAATVTSDTPAFESAEDPETTDITQITEIAAQEQRHADFAAELRRSLGVPDPEVRPPGRRVGTRAAAPLPLPAAPVVGTVEPSRVSAVRADTPAAPVPPAPVVLEPVLGPTLQPAGKHVAPRPRRRPAPDSTSGGSPLGGSVLSPQTWRQAMHAVTGRAS